MRSNMQQFDEDACIRRYTEICGFQGVFAGLLVGLKQIMPENDVTLLGYVRFRAKVCTMLISLCAALFCMRPARQHI